MNVEGHLAENHLSFKTPPIPNLEASVKKNKSTEDIKYSWNNATPFQEGKKDNHHDISALAKWRSYDAVA